MITRGFLTPTKKPLKTRFSGADFDHVYWRGQQFTERRDNLTSGPPLGIETNNRHFTSPARPVVLSDLFYFTCYRMKNLPLLLLGVACAACTPDAALKECPCTQSDPTKRFYNQVLTQLIENRLSAGLAFLPNEDVKQIWEGSDFGADTVRMAQLKVRAQNKLHGDTARYKTYYLNITPAPGNQLQLAALPAHYNPAKLQAFLLPLLAEVAPQQEQIALDSLNQTQQRLQPEDFQLCMARLTLAPKSWSVQRYSSEAAVGRLTFSAPIYNVAHDKALVAYSWVCGARCGVGEVLLMEKVNGNWRIKRAEMTWMS